jgi:hypothetical protein
MPIVNACRKDQHETPWRLDDDADMFAVQQAAAARGYHGSLQNYTINEVLTWRLSLKRSGDVEEQLANVGDYVTVGDTAVTCYPAASFPEHFDVDD